MSGLDLPSLLDAEQLLTTMGQSVIVIDHCGIIVSWSAVSCELFGWTAEEAIGQHGQVLLVPAGLVQNVEQIAADLRAGRSWTGGFTTQHRDGSTVRVLSTNTPILHSDGSFKALIVMSTSLDAALNPLLANSSDATVVVGLEGLVHFASHATTRLYGWLPGELVGQSGFSLVHPEDHEALSQAITACPSSPDPAALPPADLVEVRVRAKDGTWLWTELALSNMTHHPAVRGTVLNLRDVSDRRAAHDRLRHLSEHDAVTDLPNRQWMAEQIQYGHPQRGTAGAVLLVKVAGLRELNHRFGHVAGDDLLRRLGAMLSAALGPQDLCGSLGGGEFLVLLQDADDRAATSACVERIQAALHQGLPIGASTVIPSTHIGATLLAGRRRAHELIREVVTAAEQARDTGPRCWLAFDELGTDGAATGGVLAELTAALPGNELRVHYQPVVALAGRKTVGVEALVRWQHPSRGLLSPHAFLEAAEDTDLINDIGAFVLHQACRQVASWPGEHLTVAVNVSARQLADSDLVQVIESALAQAGLAAQRLVLEITETALLQDLGIAVAVLGKCRALGVRVAIDDFGTGFAGFGYLRELPIDEIKIDRSFVTGLGVEGFDSAIVGGIIHMAQALGLRTIAEGIETDRQAERLTDLGCDLGQGYLWSPAVPGDAAALLAGPDPD